MYLVYIINKIHTPVIELLNEVKTGFFFSYVELEGVIFKCIVSFIIICKGEISMLVHVIDNN